MIWESSAKRSSKSDRLVGAVRHLVAMHGLEGEFAKRRLRHLYPPVLPAEKVRELVGIIKKLATNWAEEERMLGKKVFYWHILTVDSMHTVASQVPTTMGQLRNLNILGENILKEYGDRIIKMVHHFVVANNLEEVVREHWQRRRPMKRQRR